MKKEKVLILFLLLSCFIVSSLFIWQNYSLKTVEIALYCSTPKIIENLSATQVEYCGDYLETHYPLSDAKAWSNRIKLMRNETTR